LYACWALSPFTKSAEDDNGGDAEVQGRLSYALMELGVCRRLCELMRYPEGPAVATGALFAIGNLFSSGNAIHQQVLIDTGALPSIKHFLRRKGALKAKEFALGALLSLLCSNSNNFFKSNKDSVVEAFLDSGLIEQFSGLVLEPEETPRIQLALVSEILSRTLDLSATLEQTEGFIRCGAVKALLAAATSDASDRRARDMAEGSLQILYSMDPPYVDELLGLVGWPLNELFPNFNSIGGSSSPLVKVGENFYRSGDAPIDPHRRVIRELLLLHHHHDDDRSSGAGGDDLQVQGSGVPPCNSAEERGECIRKRLAPLRNDAWKRRHHLAFAHGAFRRGYRTWEQTEEETRTEDGVEGRQEGRNA
jgi:hypothetical protein